MSEHDDGYWPGNCPYDHGEPVLLVPIKAVVLCSNCDASIMRNDCRASDGQLICGECAMGEIAYDRGRKETG